LLRLGSVDAFDGGCSSRTPSLALMAGGGRTPPVIGSAASFLWVTQITYRSDFGGFVMGGGGRFPLVTPPLEVAGGGRFPSVSRLADRSPISSPSFPQSYEAT